MSAVDRKSSKARRFAVSILVVALLGTALVVALAVDIERKRSEGRQTSVALARLEGDLDDPAVWGRAYPLEYQGYLGTVDHERTRFGGSDALPRTPTEADPRTSVAASKLEADPRLIRMWAGYGFAIDHREERGHAYMLDDQTFTGRQQKPQPGACLQCHASIVSANRALGGDDADEAAGAARLAAMSFAEARTHVDHAIGCIDCHDPETLRLRVTRPAFIEGLARLEAARGRPDYDVNTMASRGEMRSFVCAQCHSEYHFEAAGPDGSASRLVHPWDGGLRADEMLAQYDAKGFRDWVHAATGAPMLKAQHPEFELWSEGIHARAGVACVDCHMPYQRVGGTKITDHHVRSPLLDTGRACQVCHPIDAAEIVARAEAIQARTIAMQDTAMNRLMDLIDDIARATRADGGETERVIAARRAQRRASFLIDFVASENSAGFHAPQEAARVLVVALDEIIAGTRVLGSAPGASTSTRITTSNAPQ